MTYKVIPIDQEITGAVREKMISPQYGHPAFTDVARGYGPCRECLKTFEEGTDERILFTYNSFEKLSDLPLPGPVFIHTNECETFDLDGFPPDLIDLPMLLEGFELDGVLACRQPFEKGIADSQIEQIFEDGAVRFINIRNAEAGCFIARIDRD